MCLKWFFKVFVIGLTLQEAALITTDRGAHKDEIEKLLWNLTNYSLHYGVANAQVQGRQRGYGQMYPQRPNSIYRPYQQFGGYPTGYQQGAASIMDVLHSIAQNDELHCVPKLLCELTSGAKTGYGSTQQSSLLSLPFNINMDSLLSLFTTLGGSNPLLLFGRAALLGYSSTSGTSSCYYAFPRCPTNADQLVNYLNNHNGGFFRYFQGVPTTPLQPQLQNLQYYQQQSPFNPYIEPQQPFPYYQQFPNQKPAEQRILSLGKTTATSIHHYPFAFKHSNRLESGIKFPVEKTEFNTHLKSPKTLTFPDQATSDPGQQFYFRAPKKLTFPQYLKTSNKEKNEEILDFQRPLPNHIASPLIFPTRTGTGELLLDSDQLDTQEDLQYYFTGNKLWVNGFQNR